MYCEPCVALQHCHLPTHMIEKWNGQFFDVLPLNELEVEARVQLGHVPGPFYTKATPAHRDFTVIDTLGVRIVKVNFCGCESTVTHRQQLMRACLWPATSLDPQTCATFNVIRLFEAQNCLGKISAYDFVRSLELLTNNDGLKPTEDRRRAFRAIVRQYRMMEMLKRAGRGQEDSGIKGTAQGELALDCCACPQPEKNLPEGWEEMDEDQRYKYFLILSQDANFKLINGNISTEERDPVVDGGAAYFCNRAEYSAHIRKHVEEEEISSCSGFQAMFLANAKRVKGLRVTGIGGGNVRAPQYVAPQRTGRSSTRRKVRCISWFCNMDFLFFAAVLNFALMWLILSYDIACQFSKNIWTRMPNLPEKYHLKIDCANIRWMVPNFHLPPHKTGCHSPFSFHWLWGAGCTHGETVEQNREFVNRAAASTKLMALGAGATALEGLFAFHNWRRLVAHREWITISREQALIREYFRAHFEATNGRGHQRGEVAQGFVRGVHKGVDGGDARGSGRVEGVGEEMGDDEARGEREGVAVRHAETTLKDVRLKLAKEEYERTGDGDEVGREDTPSTFLSMGMEIEEGQYVTIESIGGDTDHSDRRQLTIDIKAAGPHPTPTQQLDVLKRRTQLRARIKAFRKLQRTYMPAVRRYLTRTQRVEWDGGGKELESTRLFMPSDLSTVKVREKACVKGLDGVEARLRDGEAGEVLDGLRDGLRTRTATTRFKVRNWSGQRALTRGQGILGLVNLKIHTCKLRYRYTRQALLKLKGHGEWEDRLRVLTEDDVRALNERALTDEEKSERERLRAAGEMVEEGGIALAGDLVSGETHRTLSWIWYAVQKKEKGKEEEKLHEALHVEWWWREELVLVEEEMWRTIEYGAWAEERWRARASARTVMLGTAVPIAFEVAEGVRAYALEHADRERRTCEKLRADWGPIRARAADYLAGRDISGQAEIVVEVERDSLRWAEALAYEREEVENDMYQ
ncbi:hypothetical protein C8F04DRAFT_1193689 [Mycena alexandri]|uniref:CxC2-like cysteine cluster KDZ transposase-associated domain-containing protein n=1 Tax=Mycena alexandri TaxID=1745969 RepID=A0AAD6S8Y0_9AGAR|nr:hypothetical protein C8F04DRAFT_1193689 [Mycena alexandri]